MAQAQYDVIPVEGLEPQIGFLLAMLEATTQNWRAELGEVTEDDITWQPTPESHSIGALLLHIADVEAFWLYEVATGQARSQEEKDALLSDATDQYGGKWPAPPRKPLSWYYEQQDRMRERTRAILRDRNDPDHIGKIGEREFSLRWLLYHVHRHEAYHGGQAVLLAQLRKKIEAVAS